MSLPILDESAIHDYATPQSVQRGEGYYSQGAVQSITQREQMIFADVEGNNDEPYNVSIQWQDSEIIEANCSCPYDYDGWCKHIIATLLTLLRDPETIEIRPTLERILDRLDGDQTRSLLQQLVKNHPELIDRIETIADRLVPNPVPTLADTYPPQPVTINPAPYSKSVKRLIREAVKFIEDDYCEEDPITEDLVDIAQEVIVFVEKGEIANAIALLNAITETCAANWDDLDDYGIDNQEIVDTLDKLYLKAILSTKLPPPDKVDLQVNLESWQDEWGANFALSLAAISQG